MDYATVGVFLEDTTFTQLFDDKSLAYHTCVVEILNTYLYFLRENKSQGSVIFESRNGKDNKSVWEIFDKILTNGTALFPKEVVGKHLTTMGFINKKENNCGLQIADIVPYKLLETLDETIKDSYNIRKVILDKQYITNSGNNYFGFRKIF